MRDVSASAPGKLMLLGEHAVVYGYPCIVSTVNKRISVTVKKTLNKQAFSDSIYVMTSVRMFIEKYHSGSSFSITTSSDFSPTLGLGSSSAVTVATLKALTAYFDIALSEKEIFDLALKVVRKIHREASGFDVAAAVYGGTIYYKIERPVEKLPERKMPLLVVYSGIKADTSTLVNQVARQKKYNPAKVNNIFSQIGDLVKMACDAYNKFDWSRLGMLFNKNHQLLVELGVSSEKLNALVETAIKSGAYGAKLSGAGGGDCIIVLYKNNQKEKLIKVLTNSGGQILDVL